MMRRRAFILAEILTGMMIQAWFIVTLCGAFYLLLTFSNRIQQSNAAQDHGQRVIAYVDARIRNAGLGLWDCGEPKKLAATYLPKLVCLANLHLPIAITTENLDKFDAYDVPADGIYSGDVLTLLYAHRSYSTVNKNNSKLVLKLSAGEQSRDISSATTDIALIAGTSGWASIVFNAGFANTGDFPNIKNYAVMESSGVPVMLKASNTEVKITPTSSTTIYNMSELLPLECERMYVTESTNQRSFMIKKLGFDSGCKWNPASPHTAGILEIFMTLDTKQKPPVFELKVLVNEGKSDTPTQKPSVWPSKYWKSDYEQFKVHVSQASWKLYNLTPFYD